VRLGGASRNDANDFLVFFLIKRMHYGQNRAPSDGTNCYPSFLIVKSEVALHKSVGIIENENCCFKANIMLSKIPSILVFIPFNRIADRYEKSLAICVKYVNTSVRTLSWAT